MSSITYGELDRSLRELGSGVEAAEAHGCLCGALCVERVFPAAEWAAEVLPDNVDEAVARPIVDVLAGLREESELSNIPKLIQGTAMNLIIAGVLSMAFMGFAGLFSSS